MEKVREKLNNKDNLESADELREAFQQLQQRSLKLFEMAYKKVNETRYEGCRYHIVNMLTLFHSGAQALR